MKYLRKFCSPSFKIIFFISCTKDDSQLLKNCDVENETEIFDYLAKNNLNAEKSKSGLYYIIDQAGNGAQPTITDNVTVSYKGFYTNGSVFDENENIDFNLQGVIPGFGEGFTYFKEGATGTLLITSKLGYGNRPFGSIPAGSVLIFDIGLISVN